LIGYPGSFILMENAGLLILITLVVQLSQTAPLG